MTLPAFNPFSTRFTQPGALPFLLPPGQRLEDLIARLNAENGYGQIVAPHGFGKSTLLATLVPLLKDWLPRWYRLSTTERSLPAAAWQIPSARRILVIDGFEQLGRLTRWQIHRHCRRHQQGLLITTHRDLGLPTLFQPRPTIELAEIVIARLVPEKEQRDRLLERYDLASRLHHHRGNLREVLFELYDRWEALRRSAQRVG